MKLKHRIGQTNLLGEVVERPRYDPNRPYGTRNRKIAEERGEFDHAGGRWDDEQTDVLIEGFLDGWGITHPDPSVPSFHSVCRRTDRSVETRMWKLGAKYKEAAKYKPGPRRTRRSGPFTDRDLTIIEYSLGKDGFPNEAWQPEYLAKIMGRTPADIRRRMTRLAKQKSRPFDRPQVKPDDTQEWTWTISVLQVEIRGYVRRFRNDGLNMKD